MVGLIDSAEIEFGADRKSCEGSEQRGSVIPHMPEWNHLLWIGEYVVRIRWEAERAVKRLLQSLLDLTLVIVSIPEI